MREQSRVSLGDPIPYGIMAALAGNGAGILSLMVLQATLGIINIK